MKLLVTIMALVFVGSLVLRAAAGHEIPRNAVVCAEDAFKFCARSMQNGVIVPDAVRACLRFHEKELSPECRKVVKVGR